MNLILTSECNKHCSFCFAKEYTSSPETEIFDLDFLKNVISEMIAVSGNSTNVSQVKLLGGEPTRYPKFVELMEWLTDIARSRMESNTPMSTICVISNFLYDNDAIAKSMKDFIDTRSPFSLLINVAEMTQKQKDMVAKNVRYLMESNFDKTSMTFGFTINPKLKFEYYKDILDYLEKEIISMHRKIKVESEYLPIHIRLSLANPERGTAKFSDLLKNKELYSQTISNFVSWGKDNDAKIRFDCGIYPCLFDKKVLPFILDWSEGFQSGCGGSAFDLFPTGRMINCYPGKDIESNYHKYESILPLTNEVDLRHKIFRASQEYPVECQACEDFMKKCNGPCSGYL